MKHAIGPRKEMGVRTIFNVLGPLTNPAGAPNQVLGVFANHLVEPLAEVLRRLGSEHVLVVNAEDGMDEISIGAPTFVAELKGGKVDTYNITPEDFGMERGAIDKLSVDSAAESLAVIKNIFTGASGPARDIVQLNAGAAIYAAGLEASLADGVTRAGQILDSGAASEKLQALVDLSQKLGG